MPHNSLRVWFERENEAGIGVMEGREKYSLLINYSTYKNIFTLQVNLH